MITYVLFTGVFIDNKTNDLSCVKTWLLIRLQIMEIHVGGVNKCPKLVRVRLNVKTINQH